MALNAQNPTLVTEVLDDKSLRRLRTEVISKMCQLQDEANDEKFRGDGSRIAWSWGYLGRAAAALVALNGDTELIDHFERCVEKILQWRDDKLGLSGLPFEGSARTWSTLRRAPDDSWRRIYDAATTGLILLPMTDMMLVCQRLSIQLRTHQMMREMICDGVDAHLGTELRRPSSEGIYFMYPADDEIEPLNHQNLLGAVAAEAYSLFRMPRFLQLATELYRFFKWSWCLEENETVSWAYRPTSTDRLNDHPPMRYPRNMVHAMGGEYFYKVAVTIELPLAMHRSGIVESDDDLSLIAYSISKNILISPKAINFYFSPRKLRYSSDPVVGARPLIRPQFLLCFLRLRQYDPSGALEKNLVSFVAESPEWFPKGLKTGYVGLHASATLLCAKIS